MNPRMLEHGYRRIGARASFQVPLPHEDKNMPLNMPALRIQSWLPVIEISETLLNFGFKVWDPRFWLKKSLELFRRTIVIGIHPKPCKP